MNQAIDLKSVELLEGRLTGKSSPYALITEDDAFGSIRVFAHGPKNIVEIIQKLDRRTSVDFISTPEESVKCGKVLHDARLLAYYLRKKYDVYPGEKIGIRVENSIQWVVLFFGVILSGAVPVLLSEGYDGHLTRCLSIVSCRLIFGTGGSLDILNSKCQSVIDVRSDLFWKSVRECSDAQLRGIDDWPSVAADSPAIISFTSGSTGAPKAVVSSHRGVVTGLMNMLLGSALSKHAAAKAPGAAPYPLILAPLSYISGYTQLLLVALLGGRLVIGSSCGSQMVRDLVLREKVTSIVGLSDEATTELLTMEEGISSLKSLRGWSISGTAITESFLVLLRTKLPDVTVTTGYGLTEIGGSVSSTNEISMLGGLTGRVVPTAQVKITDSHGRQMQNGEMGEIWLRGAMLMLGYLHQDGSLVAPSGGWFKTGDIGIFSDARELTVLGRKSDTFDCNGKLVFAQKLEGQLALLPFLQEVCVLVPDATSVSNTLSLAIAPNDIASDDIAKLCKHAAKLCGINITSDFVYLFDKLPRTVSGKIARKRVAELLARRDTHIF